MLKYIALLGNAHKSILNISLGDGFSIHKWNIDAFVELYCQLHATVEHEVLFKIDEEWGYGHHPTLRTKYVYVVIKKFETYPPHPSNVERLEHDDWIEVFHKRHIFEQSQEALLKDKITKLRLCAEGSIKVCHECFYEEAGDEPTLLSSTEETLHCENRIYKVTSAVAKEAQKLLENKPLSPSHKYIKFALDSFEQSYRVAHIELEFLTLMIAFEAIYNDGKQELRNKVARSCAVLLGKTVPSARSIFREVKELYDKRSMLVHTGDRSKIVESDVLLLKSYVRQSLYQVIELDFSKDKLTSRLTELGFGSCRHIKGLDHL